MIKGPTKKDISVPFIKDKIDHKFSLNVIPEGIMIQKTRTDCIELKDSATETTVNSACMQNHDEITHFAKSANFAELQNDTKDVSVSSELRETPFIPSDIYQKLPHILMEGSSVFTEERERDVFLTSALSVISGCLPDVSGIYANSITYPNLFSFSIAPPASGKGSLRYAKVLGDKIHDEMLNSSNSALQDYQENYQRYKTSLRTTKNVGAGPIRQPIKPPWKVLFIPANVSNAKFIWHLVQNEGTGIVVETEADSMINAFKQEWGAYSDLIRKAFQHERVSSSKKIENEYLEVKNPCLSIALSGTPNQVLGLIQSSEDGMFSRFIFYAFEADPVWKDVTPAGNGFSLDVFFERLSDKVKSLFDFLYGTPTIVGLSPEQWQRLNQICVKWLDKVVIFNGVEATSIVKRLGLILFRICLVFTAIRKFEDQSSSIYVHCTDQDFESALKLSEVYLEHSLFIFNNLPKQNKSITFNGSNNKQRFYNDLPDRFRRSEAVKLGKKYGLGERTVDDMLKKLQGKYLQQESFGTYSKMG